MFWKPIGVLLLMCCFVSCDPTEGSFGEDGDFMEVMLELDGRTWLNNLAGSKKRNPEFQLALREMSNEPTEDFVSRFAVSWRNNRIEGQRLSAIFSNRRYGDLFDLDDSDEQIIETLKMEHSKAMDMTKAILKRRLEQFDIDQFEVVALPGDGLLRVRLSGVEDKRYVRRLLRTTGELRIAETMENYEAFEYFNALNDLLAKPEQVTVVDTSALSWLNDTLDVIEPEEQPSPLFEKVKPAVATQLSGEMTWQEGCVIGYVHLPDTAVVNEMLARGRDIFPSTLQVLWGAKENHQGFVELYAVQVNVAGDEVSGGDIIDAYAYPGEFGGTTVRFDLNSRGTEAFADLTRSNIGKPVAIIVDDQVLSAPHVMDEIPGGSVEIALPTDDIEEAENLSRILKTGSFPAPVRIVDETTYLNGQPMRL